MLQSNIAERFGKCYVLLVKELKYNYCLSWIKSIFFSRVSVGSIERRLLERTRKTWNRRGEKELVILMDESTKFSEITPECRIQRLKDVIFTYDPYSSLKREPVFLDGGFHSWLWHYPSLALKPELPTVFWKFSDFDLLDWLENK